MSSILQLTDLLSYCEAQVAHIARALRATRLVEDGGVEREGKGAHPQAGEAQAAGHAREHIVRGRQPLQLRQVTHGLQAGQPVAGQVQALQLLAASERGNLR